MAFPSKDLCVETAPFRLMNFLRERTLRSVARIEKNKRRSMYVSQTTGEATKTARRWAKSDSSRCAHTVVSDARRGTRFSQPRERKRLWAHANLFNNNKQRCNRSNEKLTGIPALSSHRKNPVQSLSTSFSRASRHITETT